MGVLRSGYSASIPRRPLRAAHPSQGIRWTPHELWHNVRAQPSHSARNVRGDLWRIAPPQCDGFGPLDHAGAKRGFGIARTIREHFPTGRIMAECNPGMGWLNDSGNEHRYGRDRHDPRANPAQDISS